MMLQNLGFALIFGIMMFIWTFVFLNRSHDQLNQAFLSFLSILLLWMVLSVSVDNADVSFIALALKTVYWLSMLCISLFCMLFVYRLVARPLDRWFHLLVAVNMLMIGVRYLYPIDYADPTFWRLSDPVIAPLMSLTFCLPVFYSLVLMIRRYRSLQEPRKKAQFRTIFWGIAFACLTSVGSEYLIPTVFHLNLHLRVMFVAVLIFVIAVFLSIMKYRLLNIQSEYLFRKLFLNACDGTVIIGRNACIISINHIAREILQNDQLDAGDRITDYIPGYQFDANYRQQEQSMMRGGREQILSLTQYPIDTDDRGFAKLLTITDVTESRRDQRQELEEWMESSYLDPLTGLFNKRYLHERFGNKECPQGLTLLFLDVDDFRQINEQYGHMAGDQVLRRIGQCMRGVLRSDTTAVRFGGDEFIVFLEGTPSDTACLIGERLRSAVESLTFPSVADGLHCTVSIGMIAGNATLDGLLQMADQAMYQSKREGKNRVTRFAPETEAAIGVPQPSLDKLP